MSKIKKNKVLLDEDLSRLQSGDWAKAPFPDRPGRDCFCLPGHMATVELFPLSQGELESVRLGIPDWLFADDLHGFDEQVLDRLTIAEVLIRGGYPEVQTMSPRSRSAWFSSYISGRILKDFEPMYEPRGDYYSRLKALIQYLSGLSGNLVKYAAISNDLGHDDKTVKRYMEVLELMFIICRLQAYSRSRPQRHVIGMPKLHFMGTPA